MPIKIDPKGIDSDTVRELQKLATIIQQNADNDQSAELERNELKERIDAIEGEPDPPTGPPSEPGNGEPGNGEPGNGEPGNGDPGTPPVPPTGLPAGVVKAKPATITGNVIDLDPAWFAGKGRQALKTEFQNMPAEGDTIRLADGEYVDVPDIEIQHELLFEAKNSGQAVMRAVNHRHSKGQFVTGKGMKGNKTLQVRGLHFIGINNSDRNGAGIRHQWGNLVADGNTFENCQDGILGQILRDDFIWRVTPNYRADSSGGYDLGRNVALIGNKFIECGWTDGRAHGCYLWCLNAWIEGNSFTTTGDQNGHHIKLICDAAVIRNNVIGNDTSRASYNVDNTGLGYVLIEQNEIVNGSRADNFKMINYSGARKGKSAPAWVQSQLIVNDNDIENYRDKTVHVINNLSAIQAIITNNRVNDHTPAPLHMLRWPSGDDPLEDAA